MRKLLTVLTLGLLATTAQAEDKPMAEYFSGNVAMTTDYTFRGISQSDEYFAVQGGYDFAMDNGFYAGVWASSVDFNTDDTTVDGATAELDLYMGYSNTLKDWFDYDVGLIYYYYPGSDDALNYNFYEVALGASRDIGQVTTGISFNMSPEYFGDSGYATYTKLSAEMPVMENLTAAVHYGHQTIEDSAAFGNPNYNDWSLGVTYNLAGFDITAAYIDTDLKRSELADGGEARGVLTVSKSF